MSDRETFARLDDTPARRVAEPRRLCDQPGRGLHTLRTPVAALRAQAPFWLKRRALLPLTALEQRLWNALKDPGRLGTPAAAKVPVYLARPDRGLVIDFLLPEYGVGLAIFPLRGVEAGEAARCSFEREVARQRDQDLLRRELGVEWLNYPDLQVQESPDAVIADIRWELGIGERNPPAAPAGQEVAG